MMNMKSHKMSQIFQMSDQIKLYVSQLTLTDGFGDEELKEILTIKILNDYFHEIFIQIHPFQDQIFFIMEFHDVEKAIL